MRLHTPIDVASRYFDFIDVGDTPRALSLLAPDAVWHQPGENRFSGVHVGYVAIASLFAGLKEVSEGTHHVALTDFPMMTGQYVACSVFVRAQRPDASISAHGVDVFTVQGEKITAIRRFSNDLMIEDEFWGRA
jgi:ketosteroid isomerase-like protein